jgi:LacI family transcriptional regulator
MTVSRALRNGPDVSRETRQKVLSCAAELGYRPNRWARSLVTRKTSIVGVVIPDISHSYFAEVTRGIEDVLSKAGYNVLLCDSGLDPEKEKAQVEMLVNSMAEGLIVASEISENLPQLYRKLRQTGVPFVLIDRFFPDCGFPAVVADDLLVGRMATDHLIQLGHTRIAHIQGPALSPASLRFEGYRQALESHGLRFSADWVHQGRFDIPSGKLAMQQFLKSEPRPTAVFAGNDPMAIGALFACQEAGLNVPLDISLVGAGNIEGYQSPNPFLTTVDWPREEMGRTAAILLLAGAKEGDGGAPEHRQQTFIPRLIKRQSTGSPPGSLKGQA